MPIIHSPSPSAPTQPTGPAQWPRSPASCCAMNASASARGVPPTAGVGWRRCRSSSTPTGRARRPSIRVPRWATERKATTEGSARHRQLLAERRQGGGDLVDDVAVLLAVLGRPGQVALGVGVGPGGLAPRHRAGQGVARHPRPVAGDQELGAGAEERAVGDGHGEDGAVGLAGTQPAQDGRQRQRPVAGGPSTGRDSTTLRRVAPGLAHDGDGLGHHGGVARRGHGGRPASTTPGSLDAGPWASCRTAR